MEQINKRGVKGSKTRLQEVSGAERDRAKELLIGLFAA